MMKALPVAAAALAMFVFASGALAANTASVAVSQDGTTSMIHVKAPQATDPIAAINIYAPSGYTAALNQAPGTNIGRATATAVSFDNNLTLPLEGTVTTDDPAKPSAGRRSPGPNAAVWNLNLSVAGQQVAFAVYVNPTSGAATALGAFNLKICFPPPDVPPGTPGRAPFGAQLLEAQVTVNNVLTPPSAGGTLRWESLFTPYNKGRGTVNAGGTFEARSLVGLPTTVGLTVKYTKKTRRYVAAGKVAEGGAGVADATVTLLRGLSATKQTKVGAAKTSAAGTYSLPGKLAGRKPFFFKATTSVPERDLTATGCTTPLPAAIAPGGCVSATGGAWSASSKPVRVRP